MNANTTNIVADNTQDTLKINSHNKWIKISNSNNNNTLTINVKNDNVEDKNKNQLYLTGNPAYVITNIDGFDPPEATINTSKNAGADGSLFNSAYANERQITITMVINAPAEQNRINLYKWFKTKFPVKLIYETESRNLYIEGYVQSIQIGYFEKKQTAQIVVLCPKPYLNGSETNEQIFSNVDPLFEFPFSISAEGIPFSEVLLYVEKSILNHGDILTGVVIKITALGDSLTRGVVLNEKNRYSICIITTEK